MPLNGRHYWIVFVASLGQLIGTAVATLAGIIISMIEIITHPELSAFMQGLIGSADLLGIVVGSVLFGKLSDRYGYLFFFRFCPALILVASLVAIFIPNVAVLTIALFVIGLGIGGEYSLDSDYISELLPVKWRPLMIGVAKTASSFGNILVAGFCFLLLQKWGVPQSWPDLIWIIAAIAVIMILCRIKFYQSPTWLLQHDEDAKAEIAVKKFLGNDVVLANQNSQGDSKSIKQTSTSKESDGGFVKNNFSRIILSGIPWACEGLGVYGIGIFLPILVMALGMEHVSREGIPMLHVISSVEITFWISCVILPGFIIGLWLINKNKSIISIQTWGFYGSAIALLILLIAYTLQWPHWISLISFMAFELFLNVGPHLVTYVLPPRLYDVGNRGLGTGIAAAIGKVGAVLGVFLIPLCLKWGGSQLVLIVSIAVMLIGGLVTNIYGKKLNVK